MRCSGVHRIRGTLVRAEDVSKNHDIFCNSMVSTNYGYKVAAKFLLVAFCPGGSCACIFGKTCIIVVTVAATHFLRTLCMCVSGVEVEYAIMLRHFRVLEDNEESLINNSRKFVFGNLLHGKRCKECTEPNTVISAKYWK